MMKGTKRHYIGSVLNGWEFIEEIQVEFPTEMSHQAKHQARAFRVRNLEHGVEMVRTIGQIRNSVLKMPWEKKCFNNLTGTTCGIYKVLELTQESKIPKPRKKFEMKWKCINLETGKEEVHTTNHLKRATKAVQRAERARVKALEREEKRQFHGARAKGNQTHECVQLYRTWTSLKQKCYSKTHKSYEHYGAIGMRMSDEWINDFGLFHKEVKEQVGYCPDNRKTSLFVKRGVTFKSGNVEWVSVNSRRMALTSEDQYGTRLLLDGQTKRERTGIEV
jgi:hypothetical protein